MRVKEKAVFLSGLTLAIFFLVAVVHFLQELGVH